MANYELPASQVDLEARLKTGDKSNRVLSTADSYEQDDVDKESVAGYAVEGNEVNAYVGVDPIYQNYADETQKPLRAEGGPEAKLEELTLEDDPSNLYSVGIPAESVTPKSSDEAKPAKKTVAKKSSSSSSKS